jgi:hypothetical protein
VQARGARVIPGLQTLWPGRTRTSKNRIEKAASRKSCRLFTLCDVLRQWAAVHSIIGVRYEATYDARILLPAGLLETRTS